ncbi:hypothetical protein Tco_0621847 [Tanacetum coccineum]
MNCMYLKFSKLYGFYMTIEVIEEGILGVYEATIACDPVDGRGSVVKFILTDQKPTDAFYELNLFPPFCSIETTSVDFDIFLEGRFCNNYDKAICLLVCKYEKKTRYQVGNTLVYGSSTTTWKKLSYDNHGESESDGIKSG